MNFSEKLYKLRIQYGYSQETLAEKLNVSRQAISKWELGSTLPETEKLIVLSKFFDVSIDYFLNDNYEMEQSKRLDRAIMKFLASSQDMDEISKELVDIMRDGVIDDKEKIRMNEIVDTLDAITRNINEIKQKMNM